MTPKEKAIEMINDIDKVANQSIEIALISVNYLISHTSSIDTMPPNFGKPNESCKEFWIEVKNELNKL